MSKVPLAKASNSKTPIGPFQMTVLHSPSFSWIILVDSGPLSRPIQPSGIASTETVCVAVRRELVGDDDVRRQDEVDALLLGDDLELGELELVSSTSDEPVSRPRALRKVKIMPPPMTILSTFSISDSMTPIFDDTFEPPTIAAKGRSGPRRRRQGSRAPSARKPATDGERYLVTPSSSRARGARCRTRR